MGFFRLISFFCVILLLMLFDLSKAQPQPIYVYHFCEGANYTNNSPYRVNLNLLLSSLSSNATPPSNQFYNTTIGQNPPDKAYGLYLCRGDATAEDCKNCVETASKDITQRCPTQKEPIIWYDMCMVRSSNRSIFSIMQNSPTVYLWNTQNITNPDLFNTRLNELMNGLVRRAANGSSKLKFATGEDANFSDFQNIYGLVQCTPDLSTSDCNKCLVGAVSQIPSCCSGKQGGRVIQPSCNLRYEISPFYQSISPAPAPQASPPPPPPPLTNRTLTKEYEMSMVRSSIRSMLSNMQSEPTVYLWNTQNITNPDLFNKRLNELMNGLVRRAADGSSELKFATGEVIVTDFQNIYGLVQCIPYLSTSDCNSCLRGAVAQIPNCCDGKQGGRVLQPSCYLRFEIAPFYQLIAPTQLPPAPLTNPTITVTQENGKKSSSRIILMVVFPSLIALILLSIIAIWFHSRRRRIEKQVDNGEEITNVESLQFDFDTIEAATDNFSDANKLGKGGFGVVYKGNLSNGQEIAVKRLSRNSGQGEEQFKNEVLLVAKLQHRNLVKLLGFCIEGEEKLLIYEFVPNTSLDHFIFDPIKHSSLNWETRYKIIGGIARGLLYLHEDSRHRIIHRDLKLGNILLDEEMNPKISDFGMARLFVVNQSEGNTNRIVGTYGYMSPEYAMHGQFSVKSDVYSFGVLLLEVVSGKKINSFYDPERFENLLSYAWRHWKEGTALELIDPILRDNFLISEVVRCIHIGLLCVQENLADRPTMATVVLMLSSYSGSLSLPSPPAFCFHGMNSNTPMSNLKPWSVNEVSNTEIYPR